MLFITNPAIAFTLNGIVTNIATKQPIANVTILDLNDGTSAITDTRGHFIITAEDGDRLRFTVAGFTTEILPCPQNMVAMLVQLTPQNVQLKEFVMRAPPTQYQKDSAERYKLYEQELTRKKIKPTYAGGLAVDGLVSSAAQRISGKYQENKRFKESFRKDEAQRFIDTRYTQEITTKLTGLKGDSVTMFINTHPMEYIFARRATELELNMWIREQYKKGLQSVRPND